MKKVILSTMFSLGMVFLSISIPTTSLAHCYSCNGGAGDGYCKGDKVKACVDAGNWFDSKCDLVPSCEVDS